MIRLQGAVKMEKENRLIAETQASRHKLRATALEQQAAQLQTAKTELETAHKRLGVHQTHERILGGVRRHDGHEELAHALSGLKG